MLIWICFAGFFGAGALFGYGLCLCLEPLTEEDRCED